MFETSPVVFDRVSAPWQHAGEIWIHLPPQRAEVPCATARRVTLPLPGQAAQYVHSAYFLQPWPFLHQSFSKTSPSLY